MTMNDANRPVSERRTNSNFGWITNEIFAAVVIIAGIAWVTWGGNSTDTAANPPVLQTETTGSGAASPLPAAKGPVAPSKWRRHLLWPSRQLLWPSSKPSLLVALCPHGATGEQPCHGHRRHTLGELDSLQASRDPQRLHIPPHLSLYALHSLASVRTLIRLLHGSILTRSRCRTVPSIHRDGCLLLAQRGHSRHRNNFVAIGLHSGQTKPSVLISSVANDPTATLAGCP